MSDQEDEHSHENGSPGEVKQSGRASEELDDMWWHDYFVRQSEIANGDRTD